MPEWSETVVAGKLFAILTESDRTFAAMPDAESLTIDKGVLRLDMKDGRSFDISVREREPV